jgi:hypothetical protein
LNFKVIEKPLFIILCWGIIFYYSLTLAKGLSKKFWVRALSVPFLATIIDLGLDPVASRLGLWTWVGYGHEQGILGVPLANFIGWYLVIFSLMICLRLIDHVDFLGRAGKYIITPIIAYAFFIILLGLFQYSAIILGIGISNQFGYLSVYMLLIGSVCLLGWIVFPAKAKLKAGRYYWLLASRLMFYFFIIIGAAVFGLWQESDFIIIMAFVVIFEVAANVMFKLNSK